jgi:tight adherence protein C
MIAISFGLALTCGFFAISLFVDLFKTKRGLYGRLVGLAPGAPLNATKMKNRRLRSLSKSSVMTLDTELIELVEMISATLLAGESLFKSILRVSKMSSSTLAGELKIMLNRIELGGEISSELSALCQRVPTDSVREFTNKLSLAISRGTPLANSLISLAVSLRASNSAALLRRAGANETKMLIPVVLLICPVTVIFALYPSSQFLALGF